MMIFFLKPHGILTEYSFFLNIFCKIAAEKFHWMDSLVLLLAAYDALSIRELQLGCKYIGKY